MPETSTHPSTPRELLEHALPLYSLVHNPAPDPPQRASAFNQPLSLDTSSVTTMSRMLSVRWLFARTLRPISTVGPFPCCRLRRRRSAALRLLTGLTPTSYAPLSTRQLASAFNQPLSFDTSSVTDMGFMFYVRPVRALRPISSWALPLLSLAPPSLRRPPLPTGLTPASYVKTHATVPRCWIPTTHLSLYHFFDLAVCVGVQPAAEC